MKMVGMVLFCLGSLFCSQSKELTFRDNHTFSYRCPLGHPSPDGTGLCNQPGCHYRKSR